MGNERCRRELGQFLRSRRLQRTPEAAGLTLNGSTRRRTKGLRREELAALSGISLPWYTQLEQGRDINVSEQVLDSLARVLELAADEHNHLYFLANKRPQKQQYRGQKPVVSDSLTFILDQFQRSPAYITDEQMNVLAWNELAAAVFGPFSATAGRERNIVWRMFMLPACRTVFTNWESVAGSVIGEFRALYSRFAHDPWYEDFIAELIASSPEFASWWERYEVTCIDQHPRVLSHPTAGCLNLARHVFPVQETDKLYLDVFTPDLNDGSVERLESLTAAETEPLVAPRQTSL